MAQVTLFQTIDDELRFVEFVLTIGLGIVPNVKYPSPKYEILGNIKDYTKLRDQAYSFFLISESFIRFPLEIKRLRMPSDETIYYISPMHGGPALQFHSGGIIEEDGTKFIRQGGLSYYPAYWVDGEAHKPSAELIKVYKSLVANLKKSSIRIKHGKMVFWIGNEAEKAIRNGAKLHAFKDMSASELLNEVEERK